MSGRREPPWRGARQFAPHLKHQAPSMTPPSLCSICADCLVNHRGKRASTAPRTDDWYFDHHEDIYSLERSAKAQCALCTRLWLRRDTHQIFTGTKPLTYINFSSRPSLTLRVSYEPDALDVGTQPWGRSSTYVCRSTEGASTNASLNQPSSLTDTKSLRTPTLRSILPPIGPALQNPGPWL